MKRMIYFLLFVLYKTALLSQCENRCLHYDGIDDFLKVPNLTLSAKPSPASSFTIEMWFNLDNLCSGNTEPTLVEFTPVSTPTIPWGIFYCNSKFTFYRGAITYPTSTINLPLGSWHHIAIVVTGSTQIVYLDGVSILIIPLPNNINITELFIGSKNTTSTIVPNSFNGSIDEIKIWTSARTAAEILNSFHCVCNSSEPNLVCCIPLDQGIAAGNNSGMLPVANDIAIALLQQGANNGDIGNFNLGLSSPRDISNFICSSNKDLLYPNYQNAEIKYFDYLSQNMEINSICSGDALNIKIMQDGQIVNFPNPPNQMSLEWQEFVSGNWVTVTSFTPVSGFAFPIAPQTLLSNCTGTTNGFESKIFRIQFTLTDPSGGSCIYYSKESTLKICCPLSDFSLNVSSSNLDNLYCQPEAASFVASIVSPDLFVNNGNVQIQWFVNNVLQTGASSLNFNYNPLTIPANLCFKAVLKNCNCPDIQKEICFQADPQPSCLGALTVDPEPVIKVITANTDYQICPNSDAQLRLIPSTSFTNGILNWQYEFPNTAPNIWNNLGTTNTLQATNILPQLVPPNTPNPSIWPAGETCIRYRVINSPFSNPSGCVACTSNIIKICLRPEPPLTNISGNNMICVGGSTVLTVNSTPGYTYTWFLNGQALGFTGTSYTATQSGNYWVEITSTGMSCLPKQSSTFTLMICKITPQIKCPPCTRIGQSVILDASVSQDDCNKPLQYSWSASNGGPLLFNGNPFVHNIGSPNTTYTLTVTNSIGCSATTSMTLKACPN